MMIPNLLKDVKHNVEKLVNILFMQNTQSTRWDIPKPEAHSFRALRLSCLDPRNPRCSAALLESLFWVPKQIRGSPGFKGYGLGSIVCLHPGIRYSSSGYWVWPHESCKNWTLSIISCQTDDTFRLPTLNPKPMHSEYSDWVLAS